MENGRAKINNKLGSYEIIIPSESNNFMLFLGPIYLGIIIFVFNEGFREINFTGIESFKDLDFSSLIWILVPLFALPYMLLALLWTYFGKEVFFIERGKIQVEKSILGVGKKVKIRPNEIKNIRFQELAYSQNGMDLWKIFNRKTGKIQFDYNLKTYGFGIAVDDPEAKYLIEEIVKRIDGYTA